MRKLHHPLQWRGDPYYGSEFHYYDIIKLNQFAIESPLNFFQTKKLGSYTVPKRFDEAKLVIK